MKRFLMMGAAAGSLFLGLQSASALIVIDSFDVGSEVSTINTNGTTVTLENGVAYPTSDVLGGYREIKHHVISGAGGPIDSSVAVFGGSLFFNNDSGVNATLILTYDGPGSSGLGGVNLTANGEDRIRVNYMFSDLGSDTIVFLSDSDSTYKLTKPSTSGPSVVDFLYADFVFDSGVNNGLDLTNIYKVVFEIDAKTAGDYQIDIIATGSGIPEPVTAGLSLLSLGALGLFATKRRQA